MSAGFTRRSILAAMGGAGALGVLGLPLRAFANAVPSYYPAGYAEIIEASKKEGRLFIYSNMSAKSWAGIQRRFNELYPWINVEILELNSDELMERYMAERGTGAPTCDFLTSGALEKWFELMKKGEILAYDSPEKSYFPAWSMPQSGLYTIAIDPLLIVYNKLLLSEDKRPKGLENLAELVDANPDLFNGKIAVFGADVQTAGYLGHKDFVKLHGDKTWDWFSRFGPATKSESSTGVAVEKILSGEYVAGYFLASGIPWQAAKDPARSAVIGWNFVNDGQPLIIRASAIPAGATNVNSAKLWLDVTLSFEGQKGLVEGGRTPLREDVKSSDVNGDFTYASVIETVGEKNVLKPSYDPTVFDDYDAFVKRWREAFARK
ncbi:MULTISPECIES: ABC transporter substrate-binding protein [Ensifer]|jgi:iron(III) transport system substrate-binding protein|uniref:ABC transporter substrate-binding protein n=1 Tax=Ensifer TaxID=106591 RepID=UPI0009EC849F|nr:MULTISPECIES: extracellular solute-binding protein [Ensifer]